MSTCVHLFWMASSRVRISTQSLSSSLPPASIILNRNKLTGTIPSYIGRLDRLRNLLLHSNRFEGDMPEEICELHQEDELDWITIDCDRMDCDSDCDCECA